MQLDGAALSHIALIGNFLPRKCGIATYTTDTFEALRRSFDILLWTASLLRRLSTIDQELRLRRGARITLPHTSESW